MVDKDKMYSGEEVHRMMVDSNKRLLERMALTGDPQLAASKELLKEMPLRNYLLSNPLIILGIITLVLGLLGIYYDS